MEPSLADHVPAVTNRESPAWGSGRIPQAGLSYDARPVGSGSARLAVAIANPKVAILVPPKCPDELQSKNPYGEELGKLSITLACRYLYEDHEG